MSLGGIREECIEAVTRLGTDAPKLKQFAERPQIFTICGLQVICMDSSQTDFFGFPLLCCE